MVHPHVHHSLENVVSSFANAINLCRYQIKSKLLSKLQLNGGVEKNEPCHHRWYEFAFIQNADVAALLCSSISYGECRGALVISSIPLPHHLI